MSKETGRQTSLGFKFRHISLRHFEGFLKAAQRIKSDKTKDTLTGDNGGR